MRPTRSARPAPAASTLTPPAYARRLERRSSVSDEVLELAARRLRLLGHAGRLRLLEQLAGGPRSVTDLARATESEHHLVSKHLAEMHRAGLVRRVQEGNFAIYSLPDASSIKAVGLVCHSVLREHAQLVRLANGHAQAD